MINIHRNIKEKYGLEAIQQLHLWEKNVIKVSNYKNHRIFTLKCIGQNVIPVSIRLKPVRRKPNISASARKIIEKAENQLMQDRVRCINNTIQASEDNGIQNKTNLVSMVTQVDLDRCTNFIEKVRLERFNKVKARQVKKFDILCNKHSSNQASYHSDNNNRATQGVNADRPNNNNQSVRLGNNNQVGNNKDNSKWVINLSKTELTPTQKSVLEKGPNFAITPNNIPNLDYITAIETMCSKLKDEDVAELRGDINAILRKGKATKSNLNKQERIALAQCQRDKDSVILIADKGVAMVVLARRDCINKAKDLLSEPSYKELPRDPTNKIKAQLITKPRRIKKDSKLDEGTYKAMYPAGCVPPKFYGLPKIHKTGTPLSPIVSSRDSVTYGEAKVLSKLIKPLVVKSSHHIQRMGDFVTKAKKLTLQAVEFLSSYDVTSLFTSVPIDPALNIKDLLEKDEKLNDRTVLSVQNIIELLGSVCILLTFLFKTRSMSRLRVYLWDHQSVP